RVAATQRLRKWVIRSGWRTGEVPRAAGAEDMVVFMLRRPPTICLDTGRATGQVSADFRPRSAKGVRGRPSKEKDYGRKAGTLYPEGFLRTVPKAQDVGEGPDAERERLPERGRGGCGTNDPEPGGAGVRRVLRRQGLQAGAAGRQGHGRSAHDQYQDQGYVRNAVARRQPYRSASSVCR